MIKNIDTVIIGGGVSGLACANKLREHNSPFLLITKNIGGRISYLDDDSTINFGAVYMNDEYKHTLPLVRKIESFLVRDFIFFFKQNSFSLFSIKSLKYYPTIFRFLLILYQFKHELNIMRKKAETIELRIVIKENFLLNSYWNMPVPEFLKKNNFEEIDYIFGQPTCGTNFFTQSKNLNTFYYLFLFISLIRPSFIVDLQPLVQTLTNNIKKQIVLDSVLKITKKKDGFILKTKKQTYLAKNVVIAAPYKDMQLLYSLPKPKRITSVWTYYVIGKRKPQFAKAKGIVLHPDFHDAYLLWKQKNKGDIIYSKIGTLNLNTYYQTHSVVKKIYWKTAAHLPNKEIIPQILDDGLYLASDYNFSLVEDAYITGLFAANSILNKKERN